MRLRFFRVKRQLVGHFHFLIPKKSVSSILTWAPHRMAFDGCEMHSTAPGANHRSDFFLSACDPNHSLPLRLCTLYHTTNMQPNTFSGRTIIPETRLLATASPDILEFIDKAVAQHAVHLHSQRHFATRPVLVNPPAVLEYETSDVESNGSLDSCVTE